MSRLVWAALLLAIVLLLVWRYRNTRPRHQALNKSSGRGSASFARGAFLELHSMLEPEKKVEILVEQDTPREEKESGDPPQPGVPPKL